MMMIMMMGKKWCHHGMVLVILMICNDMLSVCGCEGHADNHNAADKNGENDTLWGSYARRILRTTPDPHDSSPRTTALVMEVMVSENCVDNRVAPSNPKRHKSRLHCQAGIHRHRSPWCCCVKVGSWHQACSMTFGWRKFSTPIKVRLLVVSLTSYYETLLKAKILHHIFLWNSYLKF